MLNALTPPGTIVEGYYPSHGFVVGVVRKVTRWQHKVLLHVDSFGFRYGDRSLARERSTRTLFEPADAERIGWVNFD